MQIYPPSSVAVATASPQGEAFLTLCKHGKYGFALWIALAIPSHQSLTQLMGGDQSAFPIEMYRSVPIIN